MADKFEILDEELENINGGRITYTWDGTVGTIGKDGVNPYILVDKDKFIEYYNAEGRQHTDAENLRYLLEHGIAKTR